MTDRTVTVEQAEVMVGYQVAATLRSCTVTRTDGVWALAGTVITRNAYWLSQQPLTFVVKLQKGCWEWPILSFNLNDASMTAMLGQKTR